MACDLKCDFRYGQGVLEEAIPDDTYHGCDFPEFEWYVFLFGVVVVLFGWLFGWLCWVVSVLFFGPSYFK